MKLILATAVVTSLLAVPIASMADGSAGQLSRADVRAQLVALELVGYQPSTGDRNSYPDEILLAEQKVAQQDAPNGGQSGAMDTSNGYGGTAAQGASGDGSMPPRSPATCVGPAGFCVPYFGS